MDDEVKAVRSGRSGGVAGSSMSRESSEAGSRKGRGRGGGEISALANKYEDDEEACFTRVKELWHDRVREFREGKKCFYCGEIDLLNTGRLSRLVDNSCLLVGAGGWGSGGTRSLRAFGV